MKPLRTPQTGFTLVELVVVITVLGILAAVALPRFGDLQRAARIAKVQAVYGSLKAAAATAKSSALVSATGCGSANVSLEAATVTLINCYPTANAAGIQAATSLDSTTDQITVDLTGNAGAVAVAGALATSTIGFQVNGATTLSTCEVRYGAAAANAQPTFTVTTTGC